MLPARIRLAIRRYGLFRAGDGIVMAVSGGPDSVALLHALALAARGEGWKLHAAHLHHGIRGDEADADENLVRGHAARLGIPFHGSRLDPDLLRGPGIEARARRVRYAFLHEVARRTGAGRIATGHTRDDQAETVLLRLLRGSGARGLSGIRPRREDGVVRPLLLTSRAEVIAYLARGKLAFREDATNRDPRFLRNRVRHEVLPLLRSLSPRIDERLSALADSLRADADCLEEITARVRRARDTAPGDGLDGAWLLDLPEAIRRRVTGAALRAAGTPPDRVASAIVAILDALAEEGSASRLIELRGGNTAQVDRAGVQIGKPADRALRSEFPEPFDLPLASPGVTLLPGGRSIEATIREEAPPVSSDIAIFDLATIVAPLRVRSRRPGDRIRPRGFGRSRKVQDLLTEARVPRAERDRVPIVVMGNEVIWVVGLRASEIGAPGLETGKRLVLALREPAPDAGPRGALSR